MAEGRIREWIDMYLSEEISSSVFSILVILDDISRKEISLTLKGTINLAIECLISKKHISPKEEQTIKEALKRVERTINNGDKEDLEAAADEAMEKITEIAKGNAD
jgi:hypothetical protein